MKLLLLELEKRKSFSKIILISAGQRHTVVKVLANCFHYDCPFGHEKKNIYVETFFFVFFFNLESLFQNKDTSFVPKGSKSL